MVDFNNLNKHAPFVQKTYRSVYMHSREWVKKQPDHTIFLIMQVVEKHRKVKLLSLHCFQLKWIEDRQEGYASLSFFIHCFMKP